MRFDSAPWHNARIVRAGLTKPKNKNKMKTKMRKREDMMIEIVILKIIKHDGPKVIKNITEYFETKGEALEFMTMMMLDVTSATFKLTFEIEFANVYSSHANKP